jgi:NitT/TauT family transport system permease protein
MSAAVLARTVPPWLARSFGLLVLLVLWQAASALHLVSAFTLPPPLDIASSLGGIYDDYGIIGPSIQTAIETFGAGFIAAVLGIAVGYWLHKVPVAGRAFTNWFAALAAAPLVLLYPLFLVLVGRNVWTIIVMGAIAALPPVVLKTREGLDGVRPVLLAVGRSLNLGRWNQFRRIMLPAALPTIFTGLRLGLVFALINTVGIEFLLGFGGLGMLISDLGDRFDLAAMYAAILFVMLVSIGVLILLERTESWLLSHR